MVVAGGGCQRTGIYEAAAWHSARSSQQQLAQSVKHTESHATGGLRELAPWLIPVHMSCGSCRPQDFSSTYQPRLCSLLLHLFAGTCGHCQSEGFKPPYDGCRRHLSEHRKTRGHSSAACQNMSAASSGRGQAPLRLDCLPGYHKALGMQRRPSNMPQRNA